MNIEWTQEWPQEPGQFLFYGSLRSLYDGHKPYKLEVCTATMTANEKLLFIAGGLVLYKNDWHDCWFAHFSPRLPFGEQQVKRDVSAYDPWGEYDQR